MAVINYLYDSLSVPTNSIIFKIMVLSFWFIGVIYISSKLCDLIDDYLFRKKNL